MRQRTVGVGKRETSSSSSLYHSLLCQPFLNTMLILKLLRAPSCLFPRPPKTLSTPLRDSCSTSNKLGLIFIFLWLPITVPAFPRTPHKSHCWSRSFSSLGFQKAHLPSLRCHADHPLSFPGSVQDIW